MQLFPIAGQQKLLVEKIIPSEPQLQHITCDRWQLGHQGA